MRTIQLLILSLFGIDKDFKYAYEMVLHDFRWGLDPGEMWLVLDNFLETGIPLALVMLFFSPHWRRAALGFASSSIECLAQFTIGWTRAWFTLGK